MYRENIFLFIYLKKFTRLVRMALISSFCKKKQSDSERGLAIFCISHGRSAEKSEIGLAVYSMR